MSKVSRGIFPAHLFLRALCCDEGSWSGGGGNTPRALEGQGQTAIRGRPIGGPSGLARIVGNAPNDRHRSSSMAYLGL